MNCWDGGRRSRVFPHRGLSNKLFLTLESSRILFHFQRRARAGFKCCSDFPCAEHSPRPCVKTQTLSPGPEGQRFSTAPGSSSYRQGGGRAADPVSPFCAHFCAHFSSRPGGSRLLLLSSVSWFRTGICPVRQTHRTPTSTPNSEASFCQEKTAARGEPLAGRRLRPAGNQSRRSDPTQGVLCARLRRVGAGPLSRPEDELHGPRYTDEGPRVQGLSDPLEGPGLQGHHSGNLARNTSPASPVLP